MAHLGFLRVRELADKTQNTLHMFFDDMAQLSEALKAVYPEGSAAARYGLELRALNHGQGPFDLDDIDMMLNDFVEGKVSNNGTIEL